MKKITKILSVFLVATILFSVCSIASGAISVNSSYKEILSYYEDCVKKTSKRGLVKVENPWKYRLSADFSNLSGQDLREAERDWSEYDGEWYNESTVMFFYGTSDKNTYIEDMPDTEFFFSIKKDISDYDYEFKSVKLTPQKNGDNIIVFKYVETLDEGDKTDITYEIKTSKDGYIKYYILTQDSKYKEVSASGKKYELRDELVDRYEFKYKKVPVQSISVSETEITIDYKEVYALTVNVTPDNASFKDFYVACWGECFDYEIDGNTIYVTGIDGGTDTLEIYSYDGDKIATCEVTVKMSFFQMIINAILNFFRDILGIY